MCYAGGGGWGRRGIDLSRTEPSSRGREGTVSQESRKEITSHRPPRTPPPPPTPAHGGSCPRLLFASNPLPFSDRKFRSLLAGRETSLRALGGNGVPAQTVSRARAPEQPLPTASRGPCARLGWLASREGRSLPSPAGRISISARPPEVLPAAAAARPMKVQFVIPPGPEEGCPGLVLAQPRLFSCLNTGSHRPRREWPGIGLGLGRGRGSTLP